MAREQVDFNAEFYSNYNFSQWPAGMEERRAEFEKAGRWFTAGLQSLEANTWETFLERNRQRISPEKELADAQEVFIRKLGSAKVAKANLLRLQTESKPTWYEDIVWFCGPILVGVAFGIRMAKVTAQLCGQC